MNWTTAQKEALTYKGLGKVIYKNMYQREHQLGYGNKGSHTQYNVVIAKDAPSKDVRDIVTLHEVGHIVFRHLDVDLKKEFITIKGVCDKLGKSYELLQQKYGGPMCFLNIAMDLEVNSKLLTLGNVKTMVAANFPPCTPESFEVDTYDSFRDYYEPLISKLDENDKEEQSNLPQPDLPSLGNKDGNSGDENSNSNSNSQGNSQAVEELEREVFGKEFDDSDMPKSVENKEDEENAEAVSKLAGLSGDSDLYTEVTKSRDKSRDKAIADFIQASIRRPEKEYVNDILKLHNRGTRLNKQGILYSSTRRKNIQKPRFCFILDVSGSMNVDPIMKALGTLGYFFKGISRNSEIFMWDTQLVDRFPVDKIPSHINMGGGTDMAAAVEFAKKEGFTDCVIYSDFFTNLTKLNEASTGIGVYSICVDAKDSNPLEGTEFYHKHKKVLFLD